MTPFHENDKDLPTDRPLIVWREMGRWCAGHSGDDGTLVEEGSGATPEEAEESAIRRAVENEGFSMVRRDRPFKDWGSLCELMESEGYFVERRDKVSEWGPCYELQDHGETFATVSLVNGHDVTRQAAILCRRFGIDHQKRYHGGRNG